jgi:hypothetical protein
LDSDFLGGPDEATGILGLIDFLERTYGIRAEDQQATPDILDSNGRVSQPLKWKLPR